MSSSPSLGGGTSASVGSKPRTERVVVFQYSEGEMYGGLEMRMSHFVGLWRLFSAGRSPSIASPESSHASLITSARMKLMLFPMATFPWLCSRPRFLLARLIAFSDISTPRSSRRVSPRFDANSSWTRRGMQPLPVHRSRTRNSGGRHVDFRRRRTRCVTEAAVSCLPS